MGTDRKSMNEIAMARSRIYGLLAAIFRAEPTPDFLKELKEPDMSEVFSDLGVDLGDALRTRPDEEVLEELAIEYTRLFIGPGPFISPHESVFVEAEGGRGGDLWGKRTGEVKRFIEGTGLDYASAYNGIPDHVSVELEFLQKLAEWEAGKWAEDDHENADFCLKVEKRFIEEHLGKWVPELCDKVSAEAESPFYREMAKFTKEFIEFDYEKTNEYLMSNT
jgi:TorA maturation chaperone TorD